MDEFKKLVQYGLDANESSLKEKKKYAFNQLKAYLIESNIEVEDYRAPDGEWKRLGSTEWYVNTSGNYPYKLYLDTGLKRVWILYSLLEAKNSDKIIKNWIDSRKGLDNCWLSRKHLLHWENHGSWTSRGYGFKFSDGLYSKEEAGNLSLKAWYRPKRTIEGIEEIIESAKENFAIHSSRWDKRDNGYVTMSTEWYSNGKVTVNKGTDVDETLLTISEIANNYFDSLNYATDIRNKSMGAFELNFKQEISLTFNFN